MKLNYPEWEMEFQQRERHSLLMADLWCRALHEKFEQEIDLPVGKLDYFFTSKSKGYDKIEQKGKIIGSLKKAVKNPEYLDYVFLATENKLKILEKFVEKCLDEIGKKDITLLWQEYVDVFTSFIPWFYIPYYVAEGNFITDRVKEGIEKQREKIEKVTDLNNALMLLVYPTKPLLVQEEKEVFCKLINSDNDKEKIKNYLKNFGWMKTYFILPMEQLTEEELLERIKNIQKNNFIQEHEQEQEQRNKNHVLVSKLSEVFRDDKLLLKDIENARKLGWLLSWSVERSLYLTAKLIPFYKLIAERIGVEYSSWNELTIDEISGLLNGEKMSITKKILKERFSLYFFGMIGGEIIFIEGKEAENIINDIEKNIEKVANNVEEFRGFPASPGKVKGKIRIVPFAKDSHQLEEGEILVCPMTSPDYLMAMKRSAAIITDEGGLLCHAAIVARELNKPCIIGTKIATQVLKDGDLVEVDAEKGIVRVIKNI